MKKKFIITIVVLLCVVTAVTVSAFEFSDCNIRLGDEDVEMKYPVFMQDDRVYVSLRNMCDLLGIPVHWNEEENRVHIDIHNKETPVSNKTERKEDGVIPDEETALAIGKIYLEKYSGKQMEYETDKKIYYLKVRYKEAINAWIVHQTFEYKDENIFWISGDDIYVPTVTINKDTGEIIYINTFGEP